MSTTFLILVVGLMHAYLECMYALGPVLSLAEIQRVTFHEYRLIQFLAYTFHYFAGLIIYMIRNTSWGSHITRTKYSSLIFSAGILLWLTGSVSSYYETGNHELFATLQIIFTSGGSGLIYWESLYLLLWRDFTPNVTVKICIVQMISHLYSTFQIASKIASIQTDAEDYTDLAKQIGTFGTIMICFGSSVLIFTTRDHKKKLLAGEISPAPSAPSSPSKSTLLGAGALVFLFYCFYYPTQFMLVGSYRYETGVRVEQLWLLFMFECSLILGKGTFLIYRIAFAPFARSISAVLIWLFGLVFATNVLLTPEIASYMEWSLIVILFGNMCGLFQAFMLSDLCRTDQRIGLGTYFTGAFFGSLASSFIFNSPGIVYAWGYYLASLSLVFGFGWLNLAYVLWYTRHREYEQAEETFKFYIKKHD